MPRLPRHGRRPGRCRRLCLEVVLAAGLGTLAAGSAAAQPDAVTTLATPAIGPTVPEFRHFVGRRYITVTAARVQRAKLSTSRILADIPRLHLVYAEPTDDPDWLAVRGAGASAYPQFDTASAFVDFRDGRLVLPAIEDTDRYVSLIGFLPRSAVVALDAGPAPPPLAGLRPVPPLWEKLGIAEPRSFAALPDAAPFDAIARLSSRLGACTAFFVARDIVASAGHCIPPARPFDLSVRIERGPNGREVIAGTLLDARRLNDQRAPGDDWALVRLAHAPRMAVTPLRLHHGEAFAGRASVRIVTIGYPADLRAVSIKLLGYQAPVVSACTALLPEARLQVSGDTLRSALVLHAPCITYPGNSGGPALVWSAARGRFEVVGVTSTYRQRDALTPVFTLRTAAIVRRFASALAGAYDTSAVDEGFGFSAALREDTPGAGLLSALLPTFAATRPWANVPLSASFGIALGVALGEAPGLAPKLPLAALSAPRSAARRPGEGMRLRWSAGELAAARALCALQCGAGQLDLAAQGRATIGSHVADTAADLREGGGGRWRLRVAGGDLFVIDGSTAEIRGVARNVMNRDDAGADAAWDAPMAAGYAPPRPAPALALSPPPSPPGAAEGDVAGATILAVSDPAALRLAVAGGALILAAEPAPLRLPGALSAGFAAREAIDEAGRARLAALLATRTDGDRERPIVIYGRDVAARSGADLARRAVQLGYRRVVWLRGGLAGWAAAGLPMAAAAN